jgi:hypothetical protein
MNTQAARTPRTPYPNKTTDQLFWAGYSGVVYLPSTVGPAGLTSSGLPVGYQAIAASRPRQDRDRVQSLRRKRDLRFCPTSRI